jgi:hypothetical protein
MGTLPGTVGLHGEAASCRVLKFGTGSWCSLVSTLDCQSRGRGFKSRRARHFNKTKRAVTNATRFVFLTFRLSA